MSDAQRAKEREDRLVLAASRGVFDAVYSTRDLGAACARYGYAARTFEGDAFETAFLWAKEECDHGDIGR